MKRHSAFLPVFLLAAVGSSLVSGQAVAQAGSSLWSLGHSDAKVLVSLDLKSLRESAVGQFMSSQMKSQVPQQAGPMAMALPLVMQALNDVDRVFISSPSSGPGPAGRPGTPAANTPFLMVMEGRFGPGSPLGFFMTGPAQSYRGVNVYEAPSTGQPSGKTASNNISLALLNESTLMIGDTKSLHSAIDRQGQANAGIPANLRARAASLSTGHDFWVVVQDSLGALPSNPALAGAASEIEGLEMGLGLRDGFQLDMTLLAKSETTARMMSQFLLAQLQSSLASSQLDNVQAAELASKLQVSSEGKQMRLSLRLSAEELQHQMRALETQRALAKTMSTQPKPPMTAGKIKIYGLDEGPREIEVKR